MADRQVIRRSLRRLEAIKTWQLAIVLILLLVLAATFLRLNNVGMFERREAVKVADEQGDPEVLQERLYELQSYSMNTMNASTDPFSLTHQYSRDYEKAVKNTMVDDSLEANRKIERDCKARTNSTYGQAWIQCFEQELAAQGTGEDPVKSAHLPQPSEYRIEYTSPLWSPDFAGFTLLAAGVVLLMIIARIISVVVLRIILRWRYKRI